MNEAKIMQKGFEKVTGAQPGEFSVPRGAGRPFLLLRPSGTSDTYQERDDRFNLIGSYDERPKNPRGKIIHMFFLHGHDLLGDAGELCVPFGKAALGELVRYLRDRTDCDAPIWIEALRLESDKAVYYVPKISTFHFPTRL